MRVGVILAVALLAAAGCKGKAAAPQAPPEPDPVPYQPGGPSLTLLYTGDARGEVAPCG